MYVYKRFNEVIETNKDKEEESSKGRLSMICDLFVGQPCSLWQKIGHLKQRKTTQLSGNHNFICSLHHDIELYN